MIADASAVLERKLSSITAGRRVNAAGRVRRYDGQIVHASAFPVSVGNQCRIACENNQWAEAEVIGFLDDYTVMVLTGGNAPLLAGAGVLLFIARLGVVPTLLLAAAVGAIGALAGLPVPATS